MKKSILFFAILALPFGTMAQQKSLSDAQLMGKETALTQPAARFAYWQDDNHIALIQNRKSMLMDVLTGKIQEAKNIPAKVELDVYEEAGDVYISTLTGKTALTQTPEMEQNPTLSPDQKYVAFTKNGNLFTIDIATKMLTQLTQDGSETVYNGYASWVYMEEILTRSSHYRAFWWSEDSKSIAFMHFDDTEVPMYTLHNSEGHNGTFEHTRYPKAGDKNPKVKVGVVSPTGGNIVWADFNENEDQYFGLPQWAPDGNLWVRWMPRRQNMMKLYAVNPKDGSKKQVYHEEQKTWIDIDDLDKFTFLKKSAQYVALSDQDGWKHIYLYQNNGNLVRQVTKGDWQVTNIQHIDEVQQKMYFNARKEHSTTEDFYVIDFSGKNLKRLTQGDYTHRVSLSENVKYFVDEASNIQTPPFTHLYDINGKLIRAISNTKAQGFADYQIPKREMITIPTSDGWNLPAHILYPLNFDPQKQYPVVFKIYGGPNAGTVKNTWKGVSDYWWAKEGVITIEVDHRASGQFGKKGIDFDFKSLGKYDIDDYMEAGKWLKKQPWVAKDKLLITGHSYGGYVTCMALTKGADIFDFGFAGAPVTSWDLYDTSYTERFMTTPQDNPEGYKQGSVLSYVDKYKGLLYIAHGDMDDNVHIQNTYQLINTLQKADKKFELMVYPGSRHGFQQHQRAYDAKLRAQFYYQHLLQKEVPAEFKNN